MPEPSSGGFKRTDEIDASRYLQLPYQLYIYYRICQIHVVLMDKVGYILEPFKHIWKYHSTK